MYNPHQQMVGNRPGGGPGGPPPQGPPGMGGGGGGGGGGGPGGGPPPGARFNELLDALRHEYENVSQDLGNYKMHRDAAEDHKIAQHINEVGQIQKNLFELERAHQKIKQQYEEEITRLRREVEARGGNPNPPPGSTIPARMNDGSGSAFGKMPMTTMPPQMPVGGGPNAQLMKMGQQGMGGMPPNGMPMNGMGGPPMQARMGGAPPALGPPPTSMGLQPPPQQQQQGAPKPMKQQEGGDSEARQDGADWLVVYNPKVQRAINVDLMHTLDHDSVVCCVKFSQDGKFVATGCNRTTQIYDVATGAKISTFVDEAGRDGDLYIRSVCFSPDGLLLATGAEDRVIRLWDIQKKRIKSQLVGHESDIYSLDFSRDGKFLISGSGDKIAKIWDLESSKCLWSMTSDDSGAKEAGVTSVAFSPDGRLVAAGSLDKNVRLWDATSGYLIERLEGHKDSVYSVAFSPDGKSLVSGSLDKTLKLWDLGSRGQRSLCRMTMTSHKDFVLSVAFSPDGNWMVSGSKDRTVQFWDPRNGMTQLMLQGHKNSVISVAVSPAGNMFATGSGDFRARIWSYKPITN